MAKKVISEELREFYRAWLQAKRQGDSGLSTQGYEIVPGDRYTDVDKYPSCDVLELSSKYGDADHLLREHKALLKFEFDCTFCPFGGFDNCAQDADRVAFFTKYAE